MARGYLPILLTVAAIWGASFMFIDVAVREMEPSVVMLVRLLLVVLALGPVLLFQEGVRTGLADLRDAGWGLALLGLTNAALPFTLIAWGQTHINSSIAAIANAPVPIFVALLAIRFKPEERVRGLRLVGIVLGFAGVGVLAGFNPEGGWWAIAGTLAATGASLSYAVSNLFAQGRYSETQPLVVVAGSSLAGALMLVPLAAFQLPGDVPSAKALASVAALGILGTAIALILYFRMLAVHGASRSSLVTYLVPLSALFYGAVLLNEPIHLNAVAGLVLILGGIALGSGVFRVARRREVVPAAPHP
jgi:drug/metabolite transporter (DMT)-like permease